MALRAPAGARAQAARKHPRKAAENRQSLIKLNFLLGLPTCLPNCRDYESWKGVGAVPCGLPDRLRAYFMLGPEGAHQPPAVFGRTEGDQTFLPLSGSGNQRGITMKKKIDIMAIPELGTSVGMHGSVKQTEVGGPLCLGAFIAFLLAL
jgi:hypothetical protein